jgi:hypothetical protein
MPRQKVSEQIALLRKQQNRPADKLREVDSKEPQATKEKARQKNQAAGSIAFKELKPIPPALSPSALLALLQHLEP